MFKRKLLLTASSAALYLSSSSLFLLSSVSLLSDTANAQFGIAGQKKKRGTTFEDLNDAAAQADASGGLDMLNSLYGDLGIDPAELEKMMDDPEMLKMVQDYESQMASAMDMLKNMSPEELMQGMQEAMSSMLGEDALKDMFNDPDALLTQLETSGMVGADKIEEYRKNPALLEKDMREGLNQMQNVLSDPEQMKKALDAMSNFGELMNSPGALDEMLGGLSSDLSDDEKIEEARLKILSDPSFGGNDQLKALYSSDEMSAIINDPQKWREAVKMGQGMMFGTGATRDEL